MNKPSSRLAPRRHLAVVALITVAAGLCLWRLWSSAPRTAASLERTFARSGRHLTAISTELPEGRAGQTIVITTGDLAAHQLFLRHGTNANRWLHVDSEGGIHTEAGRITMIRESAELLLTPSGTAFFADDVPLLMETDPWAAFWVSSPDAGTLPRAVPIPLLSVRDDFMREELEVHPYARITGGSVLLARHGGGMPTTPDEEASPNFQRAVNPFSIRTSDGGRLSYNVHAPRHWGDVHAEACFYFGIPKTGNVVDRASLPMNTDLLVMMGAEDGVQVAFGWSGTEECFVLQSRSGEAPWTVLARWQETRPPLTNWVKIGLECRQGCRIDALLDNVPVLSTNLPSRLRGPFHIQGGGGLAEFDDVRAWSLPTPEVPLTPLSVRSRQFAGKERKEKRDPEGFDEWASSSHAFRKVRWRDDKTGVPRVAIVTGEGIIGEFVCETSGTKPRGEPSGVVYCIGLYPAKPEGSVDIRTDAPASIIRASRSDSGWVIRQREGAFAGPDTDIQEPELVLGRRVDEGDRMCVRSGGKWVSLSDPIPGAVHLAVIRIPDPTSGRRFLLPPSPEHHLIHCTNLVHELFEDAPTAWNWVDGAFRMDCRWACQDQWNFMACGSTGLPYITSKRVFTGDQMHDAFMCLRATFPWDAGDTAFEYDPDSDRANKFPILIAANAWYNRHDLNLAICSDGKNPLSGYCVVFGGEDNTVTRLLRRGVTVAESRRPQHLFPNAASFMVVHYPWWRLSVNKTGPRIRVSLDGEPLFDYIDPDPIGGGHVGFWSVRNGFAISRVSSMAQEISWEPHAFYVTNSTGYSWQPLVPDAVRLTTDTATGLTEVENTFGGGFFAVRHTPEHPIDLTVTPRLELLLRPGPTTQVSLHLEIGGKPFIMRIGNSPLSGMKTFLVPGSEKDECFQLRAMPESTVRARHCLAELPGDGVLLQSDLLTALRRLTGDTVKPILTCLTVGNSSNAGYLQAGGGGNEAGSTYSIGPPRFTE